jgi:hypothetical protein
MLSRPKGQNVLIDCLPITTSGINREPVGAQSPRWMFYTLVQRIANNLSQRASQSKSACTKYFLVSYICKVRN